MRVRHLSGGVLGASLFVSFALVGPAWATGSKKLAVVSVRALPAKLQQHGGRTAPLLTGRLNTVTASTALGFELEVRNPDPLPRSNVTATLTIDRPSAQGGPIVHQQTLGLIGPGQTKSVTIGQLGQIPFAERTNVTVAINGGGSKIYPVVFSLPSGNSAAAPTPIKLPPHVVGLDQQLALTKLEAAGFIVLIAQVYSKQPVGRVLGEATNGSLHALDGRAGQVVQIDVSNGKKP